MFVAVSQGMIFLMVSFLISKKRNYDEGTETFASIAGIDWSGDETFQEKVRRCDDDVVNEVDE